MFRFGRYWRALRDACVPVMRRVFQRAGFWTYLRYAFLTLALLAAGFTLYLDFRVRSEFEGRRFALPARIYARPLELHAGLRISQAAIVDELRQVGYREGPREGESGWFFRCSSGSSCSAGSFSSGCSGGCGGGCGGCSS